MHQLFNQTNNLYDFEPMLLEVIPKIETLLKIEKKHFAVILTDDEFIKNINNGYRNKNYATDVLSFPENDGDDLGEIYISVETAMRQAVDFEVSIEDEIKRLIVHGILHLMGFDHERSPEDEVIMNEREEFVLGRI